MGHANQISQPNMAATFKAVAYGSSAILAMGAGEARAASNSDIPAHVFTPQYQCMSNAVGQGEYAHDGTPSVALNNGLLARIVGGKVVEMKIQDSKVETWNRENCDPHGNRSLIGWMALRNERHKGRVTKISNQVSFIQNSNEAVFATTKIDLYKRLTCKALKGKELGMITQEPATYGGQSKTVTAPHFYIDFKNPCKQPRSAGKKRRKLNVGHGSSTR